MIVTKALGERAALLLIIAFAGSCASTPSSAPVTGDARPVPSAEAQQEIRAAEDTYRGCLVAAAKFAENARYSDISLPLVITPMCYPQFARLEAAMAAGQTGDARKALVHDSDQRQIAYAKEAIEQERGRTTVAANR